MGRPLMLPERLGASTIRLPVILHEIYGIGLTSILEEGGDIFVGSRAVTVLLVAAITVVGPQAMDSPGVIGASHWVGIPKLDLLD